MQKYKYLMICLVGLILLGGCANRVKLSEDEKYYDIYQVDKEETKITSRQEIVKDQDVKEMVNTLIDLLKEVPQDTSMRAAIPEDVQLQSCTISDKNAVLNFSQEYYTLSQTGEILTRAAIVKTLTQIDGIEYVSFMINETPLLNLSDNPVGTMTADQFLENSGDEINAYEKVSLNLYFTNKEGTKLVPVTREVVYNSNISLEKLVMEQLIAGPKENENCSPTMNPDTELISVTVRDRICYVNLDEEFLNQLYNASAEVTIYSITDSLIELKDINKVQISVNGDTSIFYKETIPLSNTFERNLKLIEGNEKETK